VTTERDDLERLRRFLLGDIADAEREAIERQCLAEHSLIFDQLVALEDELRFDYLLGRNPLDQSYVSGYGVRPLRNPHHRFWARQYNFRFPPPPPGLLAGGPNSGLEDPIAKAAGLRGCAPQKCYVDHIEAWSLNEVAINWNAPLVWVAAFLDERAAD